MKHYYIRRVLDDWNKLKKEGIYLSGIRGEGEYKEWYNSGQLYKHCFFKNGEYNGEYKQWNKNGELIYHELYKDDEIIKDYLK